MYNLSTLNRRRFRPSFSDDSISSKLKTPLLKRYSDQNSEEEKIGKIPKLNKISDTSSNLDSLFRTKRSSIRDQSKISKSIYEDQNEGDFGCVICLTENRAREVGFACINLRSFSIELTQISDSQTYINTLTLLHNYSPIEIVMPSSLQDSGLCLRVKEDISDCSDIFKFIQRKLFNEEKGIQIFEDSCSKSFIDIDK